MNTCSCFWNQCLSLLVLHLPSITFFISRPYNVIRPPFWMFPTVHPCDRTRPSSQVARTITNMQQQIQQHQRQLYQALLMKQQQLPSHSSSSAGLHPPGGPAGGHGSSKSTLDPFTGPHQAQGLADALHTKEPPSSPNAYSTYPLCESGTTTGRGRETRVEIS